MPGDPDITTAPARRPVLRLDYATPEPRRHRTPRQRRERGAVDAGVEFAAGVALASLIVGLGVFGVVIEQQRPGAIDPSDGAVLVLVVCGIIACAVLAALSGAAFGLCCRNGEFVPDPGRSFVAGLLYVVSVACAAGLTVLRPTLGASLLVFSLLAYPVLAPGYMHRRDSRRRPQGSPLKADHV